MSDKFDATLHAKLGAAEAAGSTDEPIRVIVQLTGDVADLASAGFVQSGAATHPSEGYTIAVGQISAARVGDLAAIGHVVRISHSRRARPMLNHSIPETHGDLVHAGSPARKAAGVVVGIIDSGIDWRHPSFARPDRQQSRILGIWDQRRPAKAGETSRNGVGTVYTGSQLTNALQGTGTVDTGDPNDGDQHVGHGTHVAGIAAGDGSAATCCHGQNTFVGMAPEADIIVVRSDYQATNIIDGLFYIFDHPDAAGKPVVVNISLGWNYSPHDGTDLVEMGINASLGGRPGRAVVVAAGNDADKRAHMTATVGTAPNNTLDVAIVVLESRTGDALRDALIGSDLVPFSFQADMWYDRAGRLDVSLTASDGNTSPVVTHGTQLHGHVANPAAPADRQYQMDFHAAVSDPGGRDNDMLIDVTKPTTGGLPAGTWTLHLTNPTNSPVTFHCWTSPDWMATFPEAEASRQNTLTSPGMAKEAITVGAYTSVAGCCSCSPSGDIAEFSGHGPLVHRADPNNPKPDLVAPGVGISSANSDACNLPGKLCSCCPDGCCVLYREKKGTSMASPHVAGAAALMFEENPNLTKDDVLRILKATARPRPTGASADVWGAGKLDVKAAMDMVRAEAPPAGGGGGGGGAGPHPLAAELSVRAAGVAGPRWSPLPHGFMALRELLGGLPDGERLAAAASRHFSEIRRLINTNRRVATMWHRADGPGLLRGLVHAVGQEGCGCPRRTVGEREWRYLDRFFDMLEQFGSDRLRAGLAQHRAVFVGVARATATSMPAAA